jgi:hypothetical protein
MKESIWGLIQESFRQNSTLCKAVGYGTTGVIYFAPEGKLARVLAAVTGFGTTFAC